VHVTGTTIGGTQKDLAQYLGKALVDEFRQIQSQSRVNILTGKAA
jgi:hypothetical protein